MPDENLRFLDVDDYVAASHYLAEPRLVETRRIIREVASDATESIDHHIPTYAVDGVVVVQFTGTPDHTTLNAFPIGAVRAHFGDDLAPYRISKSAIRFPVEDPLPAELIRRITTFRLGEARAFAARRSDDR